MFGRGISFALIVIAATSASASQTPPVGNNATAVPTTGSYQIAQACGWYAISVCSRGRGRAQNAANRFGGYVIDSSSEAYPNFQPGWYCAVEGPTSKRQARIRRREMRQDGATSSYIKNGC